MFSSFKRKARNIANVILPTGRGSRILLAHLVTTANIAAKLLPAYIFSVSLDLLASGESIEILGMEFGPELVAGVGYGLARTLSQFLPILRNIILNPIAPESSKQLAAKYVESVMKRSLTHSKSKSDGDHVMIINKCYMSPPSVCTLMHTQLLPTFGDLSVATVILGYSTGAKVCITLAGATLGYSLYNLGTKNVVTQYRDKALEIGYGAFKALMHNLGSYETIHHFNNQAVEAKQLDKSLSKTAKADTRAGNVGNYVALGQAGLTGASQTGLFAMLAGSVVSRGLSVSGYVFNVMVVSNFLDNLSNFGSSLTMLYAGAVDVNAIHDAMEEKDEGEIVEHDPENKLNFQPKRGQIEFRNVTFRYTVTAEKEKDDEESDDDVEENENADKKNQETKNDGKNKEEKEKKTITILDGVSFIIPAGEETAIVGTTGAGKSTIGNLIYRFYDVTSGEILIDGHDVRDVNRAALRKSIAVVSQNPVLSNQSIYENIEYGGLCHGPVNPAEVKEAAKKACLEPFIEKLPDGLKTKVGERGTKVSGGERQRLAFARALLKKPTILILDEATSALDNNTAKEVNDTIAAETKGKTVLRITHKLSELRRGQNILVLDNGKIVEQGKHEQLLKLNGVYADLYQKEQAAEGGVTLTLPAPQKSMTVPYTPSSPRQFTLASDAKQSEIKDASPVVFIHPQKP
jgi:ABC-type multidrug transport system fused ATPase/permease subunit